MEKIRNLLIRHTPSAIRSILVQFRDTFRTFPDKAIVNNHEFNVLPDKFWIRFNKGLWEPSIQQFFARHVSPAKEIIDIGGWYGPTAFIAGSLNPPKISVVEADPENFQILKTNIQKNNLEGLIELHHICISDKTGEFVNFGYMDEKLAHSAANGIGGTGKKVKTAALEDFLSKKNLDKTNIVKIDIEGGERFIQKGLEYISEFPGIYIYLALHPPFWPDKQKTADMFLDLFEKFDVFTDTGQPFSMQILKEKMLSEKPTYYTHKKGIFFDIILKTK